MLWNARAERSGGPALALFHVQPIVPARTLSKAPSSLRFAGALHSCGCCRGAYAQPRALDGAFTLYYKVIMNTIRDNLLIIVGSFLLLAADWLAFHDFREHHTVTEWLMLVGSMLVFGRLAEVVWKQKFGRS